MSPNPFLSGLAVLGLAASTVLAGDDTHATARGRLPMAKMEAAAVAWSVAPLHSLNVNQGPGVGLPTVRAVLGGDPAQRFIVFAQVEGLDPFVVTGGWLDETGSRELLLDLPAEVLRMPLAFRAGFQRPRGPVFTDPAHLALGDGPTADCFVEDWEDHDCGTGAGCSGDGATTSAGQIVTCQWENEWGCVSAINDSPDGPDLAVLFDSADPTGGDDDLGTPLFDGADGCLVGVPDGQGPFPGNPCKAYDHVLIIQENADGCGDGFCDEPDDEGWGGTILFQIQGFIHLCSMDLLDIDEDAGAVVRTYQGQYLIDEIVVPPGPDNSLQRVFFNTGLLLTHVEVELSGSGAIAEFEYGFGGFIIN